MTTQKPRAIPLDGWQIRALQEDRLTHLWFPVLNWPPKIHLPRMVSPDKPHGIKISDLASAKPGVFQPMSNQYGALSVLTDATKGDQGWLGVKPAEWEWRCPLGRVGRHLWVQETWWHYTHPDKDDRSEYDADDHGEGDVMLTPLGLWSTRKRPSTQMPRWASRYTLEIEAVDAFQLKSSPNLRAGVGMKDGDAFSAWWDEKHGKKGVRFNYDLGDLPADVVPNYAQRKFLPDGQLFQNHPWAWRLTVRKVDRGN